MNYTYYVVGCEALPGVPIGPGLDIAHSIASASISADAKRSVSTPHPYNDSMSIKCQDGYTLNVSTKAEDYQLNIYCNAGTQSGDDVWAYSPSGATPPASCTP